MNAIEQLIANGYQIENISTPKPGITIRMLYKPRFGFAITSEEPSTISIEYVSLIDGEQFKTRELAETKFYLKHKSYVNPTNN